MKDLIKAFTAPTSATSGLAGYDLERKAKRLVPTPKGGRAVLVRFKRKGPRKMSLVEVLKANDCHNPGGDSGGGQFCSNNQGDKKKDSAPKMRTFKGKYSGFDAKGNRRSMNFSVKAKDQYEAGDAARAKWENRFGRISFPVARFTGPKIKLSRDSVSFRTASNAGPEEQEAHHHKFDYSRPHACCNHRMNLGVLLGKAAHRVLPLAPKGRKVNGNTVRKQLIAWLDKETPKLAAKVQRLLNKHREQVKAALLKAARKAEAPSLLKAKPEPTDIDEQALRDALDALDLEWVDVQDVIESDIAEAYRVGGKVGMEMLIADNPGALDLVNERAVSFAQERAAELVTDIAETTRDQLRSLITSAIEDGAGSGDLATSIEDMFGFSESRSDMIARTELAHAHTQGNIDAWQSSDVGVEYKQSILGSEHDLDDECDGNADDGPIPMDEDFSSGDDAPPFHPNCVCALLPVFANEVDQE